MFPHFLSGDTDMGVKLAIDRLKFSWFTRDGPNFDLSMAFPTQNNAIYQSTSDVRDPGEFFIGSEPAALISVS